LQLFSDNCAPSAGPPVKDRAKLILPFVLAALAYTQVAHLPLEQILNGAIAAVLFNIIYDTLLSRKLRWFAMCPVIDSMNHQSTSTVRLKRIRTSVHTHTYLHTHTYCAASACTCMLAEYVHGVSYVCMCCLCMHLHGTRVCPRYNLCIPVLHLHVLAW